MSYDALPPDQRIRWDLYDGTAYLCSGKTKAEAEASARIWAKGWVEEPVLVRTEVTADGNPRICFPVAGGTWGGLCGSSFWIDDPDGHIAYVQEPRAFDVISGQRQHLNWVSSSPYYPERKPERVWAWGFRVVCLQPHRHEGRCSEGPWSWTWRDDPRYLSNLGRRTGIHSLDELLARAS